MKGEAAGTVRLSGTAARGTVQLLIARSLFMASGYVITVMLARGLGPAEYGAYGVVMSLLLWLEVAADAGIQRATIKLIPESTDARAVASAATFLLVSLSTLLFVFCWFAAPWIESLLKLDDGAWLFRIAVIDLPFNGLYLAHQGILQGHRRFGTLGLTLVVYSVAKVGGVALLLLAGMSVEGALVVNVLATVAALGFLLARNRPRVAAPDWALCGRIVRVAAPLGVSVVTMQLLLSAHLWALKRQADVPEAAIGYYVAALNLARLPTVVPFVLTGVVLASMSGALARGDHGLARRYVGAASRFLLIVLVPVWVLGALDATPIMAFVFSHEYAAGGPVLALLLGAFCLFSVLDTHLHAMIADSRNYFVMVGLLSVLLLAIALNSAWIPVYGGAGAAWALVVSLGTGTLATVLWSARRFGRLVQVATMARVTVAVLVAVVASLALPVSGWWLVPKLGGLLLLYGLVLVALRELGRSEFAALAFWRRQ